MKHLFKMLLLLIVVKAGAQSSALAVADSLYATGDYSKAIAQYKSLDEPSAKVLLQIARAYNGKGVKTAALEFYEKSLDTNANQPIAQTEYGRLLLTRSKFATADSVFSDLASRYPDNPEYFYQWGRALKGKKGKDTLILGGDITKTGITAPEDAFARAVQLDSTHQKAIFELAKHYLQQKDYPIVEKLTRKALESDPENIEMIGVLAQNYYYKGWWTEALEWFNKLLDMGVDTLFVREKLGRAYYEKRMDKEAVEQYYEVLAYDDEDWGTHITLARLQSFLRNFDEALDHGKQALYFKDLPLDDVYFTLGRTYEFKKDFPKAMEHYKKSVKENPENYQAIYGVAVAADNYYKNKEEVVILYERFIDKFTKTKQSPYLVRLAQERVKDLRVEIFEATKEKE